MAKNFHEIRDPVYGFIKLDSEERQILNSWPLQRLRFIHQLGLTYLVYPGACHKRFEHSLGVMELAGRVFDTVTDSENVSDRLREVLPEISRKDGLGYWRRVIRIAALCHDIGHMPFSHTAEAALLPDGWNHEKMTRAILESNEMTRILRSMTPRICPEDVVKLAIGQEKAPDLSFSDWETLLAEIIVGDAFGVDRMDYLLRDAHHVGVPYGGVDYYRLIDSLRILLPSMNREFHGETDDHDVSQEPSLGVTEGGLRSAEAFLLARYFMYTQVYLHPVAAIYGVHLRDFLGEWLDTGKFSIDIKNHGRMTDNEVMAALLNAAHDENAKGHDSARYIIRRKHFKLLYSQHPEDAEKNLSAARLVYEAAKTKFGDENVRYHSDPAKSSESDFPVRSRDGRIASSVVLSTILEQLPVPSGKYVFIHSDLQVRARKWLRDNSEHIIQPAMEKE